MQATTSPFAETAAPQGRPAEMMSFMDAMSSYLSKAFDFEGRATRSEYWWAYLGMMLVSIGVFVFFGLIASFMGDAAVFVFCFAYLGLIAGYIPFIALTARRLHDVGKSGWMQLLYLVPFAGIYIFILTVMDGEPTANIYGPVPTNKLV